MSLIDALIFAHKFPHPNQGLLLGDTPPDVTDAAPVPAAVLVAITDREEQSVIFIKRTATMRKHAGQIAFPGGRVDEDDTDVIAAALREAEEEIGLDPSRAQILGTADPYRTITGYQITPVFALIPPGLPLVANPEEVDAIFEAPLAFLLDSTNHRQVDVDWKGSRRHYYEMHWQDQRIWGATAGMIVNMTRRLAKDAKWLG